MPVENCFKNTHLNEFNSQKFFVPIFHKLPSFQIILWITLNIKWQCIKIRQKSNFSRQQFYVKPKLPSANI